MVINLSRYLQTLTLTGYQKLKHYNYLIPNIIRTRYLNQPHATLQIPRHTRRPTGIAPYSLPGQSTGGLRRVTFTTTTAVPLVIIAFGLTIDLIILFKAFSVASLPVIHDKFQISYPDIAIMTDHKTYYHDLCSFHLFIS